MENDGTVTLVISLSKPSSMSYQAIVNIMNLTAVRKLLNKYTINAKDVTRHS